MSHTDAAAMGAAAHAAWRRMQTEAATGAVARVYVVTGLQPLPGTRPEPGLTLLVPCERADGPHGFEVHRDREGPRVRSDGYYNAYHDPDPPAWWENPA